MLKRHRSWCETIFSSLFVLCLTVLLCLVCRLRHSHHSEGSVWYVGSHYRGQHAARLPDLQCHVCVHGGFSGLPSQVSDWNAKDKVFTAVGFSGGKKT